MTNELMAYTDGLLELRGVTIYRVSNAELWSEVPLSGVPGRMSVFLQRLKAEHLDSRPPVWNGLLDCRPRHFREDYKVRMLSSDSCGTSDPCCDGKGIRTLTAMIETQN